MGCHDMSRLQFGVVRTPHQTQLDKIGGLVGRSKWVCEGWEGVQKLEPAVLGTGDGATFSGSRIRGGGHRLNLWGRTRGPWLPCSSFVQPAIALAATVLFWLCVLSLSGFVWIHTDGPTSQKPPLPANV